MKTNTVLGELENWNRWSIIWWPETDQLSGWFIIECAHVCSSIGTDRIRVIVKAVVLRVKVDHESASVSGNKHESHTCRWWWWWIQSPCRWCVNNWDLNELLNPRDGVRINHNYVWWFLNRSLGQFSFGFGWLWCDSFIIVWCQKWFNKNLTGRNEDFRAGRGFMFFASFEL